MTTPECLTHGPMKPVGVEANDLEIFKCEVCDIVALTNKRVKQRG